MLFMLELLVTRCREAGRCHRGGEERVGEELQRAAQHHTCVVARLNGAHQHDGFAYRGRILRRQKVFVRFRNTPPTDLIDGRRRIEGVGGGVGSGHLEPEPIRRVGNQRHAAIEERIGAGARTANHQRRVDQLRAGNDQSGVMAINQ